MVIVAQGLLILPTATPTSAAGHPCAAPITNPVACENTKPGSPPSEWQILGAGDEDLQGFATEISTNVGGTVRFKVKTPYSSYRLDIYRLGWYGGDGARKVATVTPSVPLPQTQPACLSDSTVNLLDCGNWAVSASWNVPATAVSGIYVARLARQGGPGDSHIVFVVRDDASQADIMVQASDTTWQAYNTYGGASTYPGPIGRAQKVSYNRPMTTRGTTPLEFLFTAEYPMLRFLERNGYDTTYTTGVDTERRGDLIKNHKTFLSVGHDEYWSGPQRANVKAARDAGVNLAFLAGNDMYWKIRWEPSVDGSGTPYRTMVVYKETLDRAKSDPTSTWTGTWRDPRYSPDGGLPENELIGTAYTVNCCNVAMKVPEAEGKLRLWRGTRFASLSPGATGTVTTDGIVGIEWNEDLDNGFRPAGLVRLSSTTADVPQHMLNYGNSVEPGTATHHFTMYRAPSGAIVFSAATINFSWGLDAEHDESGSATDDAIRQAFVNLLADMGVQPGTLMAGLSLATRSTDTTAPSSTITSPAAGTPLTHGSNVTVTGTASDVGGRVGGVEVSLDGGNRWHPANGRGTWTYTGPITGLGPVSIMSRAADDSGNLQAPATSRSVSVGCPCTVFGSTAPATPSTTDTTPLEAGVKFRSSVAGWVTGVRFFKGPGNTGTHTGSLWSTSGTRLATATFTNETSSGWQRVTFPQPVQITAGTTYIASYFAPNGRYAAVEEGFLASGVSSPPLLALRDGQDGPNGVYAVGSSGFPDRTFGAAGYGVDVEFTDVEPPDVTAPSVTSRTPLPGSSSVAVTTRPTAVFDEAVQPSTISVVLRNAAGVTVAGSTSYDAPSRTVTFVPAAPLAKGVTFTTTVSGAKDAVGNTMTPSSWSFTTVQPTPPPGLCPCSIWDETTTPAFVTVADPNGVELGVKFRAEVDGKVTGVRFYKGPDNTGTHTGSLWTVGGTRLATATFSSESTSGWQTVTFATPVEINANTTYVASYHTNGYYSASPGALASAVSNPPVTALGDGDQGPNGVYAYGPGSFPDRSGSRASYLVDVVFSPPPDVTAPVVASSEPGADARSVPRSSGIRVTFNEPVDEASAVVTVERVGGAAITGDVAWSNSSRTVTLTPSAQLAAATSYRVRVSGARDISGNTMSSPTTWTFTTTGVGACPCGIWSTTVTPTTKDAGDTAAVELGVKFRASADGWVYGVRFYKSAANTGTHTGSVWATSGVRLATATFTNETASGWQQVMFGSPVRVVADRTYVASYHTTTGRYAADGGYFSAGGVANGPLTALGNGVEGGNGVYLYGSGGSYPDRSYNGGNYWVDVAFSDVAPPDTVAPRVLSTAPQDGATSVATGATAQATFDEPVQASTVNLTLRDAGGTLVAGQVTYDAATRTATLTPSAPLSAGANYTARVDGARDPAGNVMSAATTWQFRTANAPRPPGSCPCSIWDENTVPNNPASGDTSAIEVGVKFTVGSPGLIRGIRFYKGAGNSGTHVGSLWAGNGTRLASATFTGESASGWQEVLFSEPVAVTAATTYVASYFAPNGNYAADGGYFSNAGVISGPLRALANGDDGGNGVYRYGPNGFPSNSYGAANYWVDVVFTAS